MAKRTRKRYTDEQKQSILAAASKDNLTALQVEKKFGVKPITYYSWRKKTGAAKRRGRPAGAARGPGRPAGSTTRAAGITDIGDLLRSEVQTRIRSAMPDIVSPDLTV